MAAILQFRQGSKSSFISSGPYVSEPFFDTDTNIIHIGKSSSAVITLVKLGEINSGSLSLSGDLTASNATLSGDITIGGNIILGDSTADDITISGQLDSDLIPKTDNTHDLGSTTKKWANLHAVSGSIDFIDLRTNLPSGTVSGSDQVLGGTNIVSSSIQVISFLPDGSVSGSSQITYSDISSIPSNIISSSEQLPDGIISGSEQLPGGIISGSEQLPGGIISGSTQITDGSGIFSSSLQVNPVSIPGFQSEVKRKLDIDGVLSGSGQLPDGTVSGSAQVIGHLPSGTVSGSEQVNANTITNFDSNVKSKIDSDGVISGSVQVDVTATTNYSSVVQTTGDQTIAGNKTFSNNIVISGDLNVDGTTTYTSTNNVNIGDNIIELNYGGSATEGGIYVKDATGGSTTSGSLLWDATNDYWKAGISGGESEIVTDSNIVSKLPSGTISGSSQVNADTVTNFDSNVDDRLNAKTVISGSSQVNADTIINFDSNVKDKLDEEGIISGSSQISLSGFSTSNLSEGLNKYYTNARVKEKLDEEGVISGSSQVNADSILNFDSNVKDKLNSDSVVSGSSQVSYVGLSNIPDNIVSGSTQINNLIIGTSYSQSIDIRLLDGFASGSATSESLHTLVGNFPTSGSLGTAAFYNVSSSLADDPSVIPNVKAVYDYINNTIGAADITAVNAGLGLSGGGLSGDVTLTLNTGSDHFTNAVQGISPQLPDGLISGSSQVSASLIYEFDNEVDNYLVLVGAITHSNGSTGLFNEAGLISGSSQVFSDVSGDIIIDSTGEASIEPGVIIDGDIKSDAAISHTKLDLDGSGIISGSAQLPTGLISGSAITTDGTDLVAIGTSTSNVGDLASGNQLSLYGTSVSGLTSFDINGTAKSFDYVSSDFRYIDTNSGVGIVLKPNADAGKAWVIDTDGDLVSNSSNASVTGSVYGANIIARGDLSGSNLLITGDITVNGTVDGIDIATDVAANTSKTGYTDSLVKTKLDAEGVLSGSTHEGDFTFDDNLTISGNLTVDGTTTSVNSNTVNIGDNMIVLNSDETGTPSQDAGIEIERGTSTNVKFQFKESTDRWQFTNDGTTFFNLPTSTADVAEFSNLYYTDARVKTKLDAETVISGSGQISIGASQVTEISNLTATEGAQLENIDSVTISNTQWGYLGDLDQDLSTNDDAIFNKVQSNNPDLTHGGHVAINSSYDGSGWGTNKGIGRITFGTLDSSLARTVATIEVKQEDNGSAYPDETYMVFKTIAAAEGTAQEKMRLSADGNLNVVGDIVAYASSDERLKDEIIPISNPLDKINSIGGYSFVWKEEKQNIYKGKDYGVIAQEIEKVLPELVNTRESGYKAVKYDKLVSLLIEGIKELSSEVKELKEKINKE